MKRPKFAARAALPAASAAAVVALLAGCAGGGGADASTGGDPVSGGSLTYALGTDIDCLDPAKSPGNSIVVGNIVDSLVYQDVDGNIQPWLASSWTVSDDGAQYTFELRDGVTFSDGTPLDAAAVKYNFDRIKNPETGSSYAASVIGEYAEGVVDGPLTFRLVLNTPVTALLQGLSLAYLGIQSPTYLEAQGSDTCGSIVGSGPFVLDQAVKGQSYTLSRRDGYDWAFDGAEHDGNAYLDSVTYNIVSEGSVRVGGLSSGQYDLVNSIATSQLAAVKANPQLEVLDYTAPGIANAIAINATSPIFSDLAVRQAFQSAVDVDTLVDAALFGQVEPARGPVSPTSKYFDETVADSYGYDPDKANRLLDEAGWTEKNADGIRVKDGRPLKPVLFTFPDPAQDLLSLLASIQQEVRKVGIDLDVQSFDRTTWNTKINANEYDLHVHAYFRADPDIARTVYSTEFEPPNGYTFARPQDPALEDLLQRGSRTPDGPERQEIYEQIQHEVIDQGFSLPLYANQRTFAYKDDVHGVRVTGTSVPYLYDVWIG
ncbi:ABC transporter substrate-binding protein [Rhodococcoides kyotonense]|uniref:Peptide/nickel transport system substrate-binding protein n=1 Tax=Rhodococcoides kyotonense TaxID=398843 RepID=A0A239GES5_9NOCA|nr:ABC transporter substrate-binding protein [Rhodococcus kyotonensis]SNS67639.1 peptide/nickel transport system substrate-binding protein [Rhodococcus kyotonensis]